ncbi:melatonin receptor type 1A-like [Phalacrocorax aristotelis]|uniref:melatonin receptor type 1A-like n=1 Tax=Phalacrocorax aristotelis TaxID=126867 RepID=UPI003F4B96E2
MRVNGSDLNGSVLPRDPPAEGAPRRPPWVTATLATILIFTIVVDLLGNLLVILSVYRNKKLRNAEISFTGAGRVTHCDVTCLRGESDSKSPSGPWTSFCAPRENG